MIDWNEYESSVSLIYKIEISNLRYFIHNYIDAAPYFPLLGDNSDYWDLSKR